MTKLKFQTYTLPAHWTSYLINDDPSSYSLDDDGGVAQIKQIDDWCAKEGVGPCVDCTAEPEFKWGNDATPLGGMCLEYTFQILDEK